jgi:hypothetical protein
MTLEIIAAFVGIFAALQFLSLLLASMQSAANQIKGRSTWTAPDGTTFEEFAVTEIENSQIMQQDFEVSRAEAIMAAHFAGVQTSS